MGDLRTYGTIIGPVKGHSVRDTDIDEQVCMAAVTTIGAFQMFDILDENDRIPVDYQFVRCHMVFDIKIEDFRRKARLVAGGHMTDAPKCMTYSSVVSRDTVRLALTIAALNDLEVKAGDVENAYVQAPVTEKIWTTLGDEWGPELAGKKALIVCAIYGLKSQVLIFALTWLTACSILDMSHAWPTRISG